MKHLPLSLLLLPLLTHAAEPHSPDSPAAPVPIAIEADRMELNQKTGSNHYLGNVVLTRGGLQIRAESILLYTQQRKLQRAVAEGTPAYLEQQGLDGGNPMHAQALQMEYRPLSDSIELRGEAQLWRDGNTFTGERIEYDLKSQTVRASGDEEGDGRVRVILQPEAPPGESEEKP